MSESAERVDRPTLSNHADAIGGRALMATSHSIDFDLVKACERIYARTIRKGACIEWTGVAGRGGYGRIGINRRGYTTHRLTYALAKGPIPVGLQIDHLCRNRRCVNPEHLEAVDNRTNVLRGVGVTAINARVTHCPQGHPYSGENLLTQKSGRRSGRRWCRICERVRDSRRDRTARRKRGQK